MVQRTLDDGTGRQPLAIVEGDKERVGLWMLTSLPDVVKLPGGYEAVGVARGDDLVGGCLYTNYIPYPNGGTIDMWAVGHDWLSRRVIRVFFGYPFFQLGCHRITCLVGRKNGPSRNLVTKLGFKLEGVAREGFGPKRDTMIFGLLRKECRWIEL